MTRRAVLNKDRDTKLMVIPKSTKYRNAFCSSIPNQVKQGDIADAEKQCAGVL
jgi:hypothetical protein